MMQGKLNSHLRINQNLLILLRRISKNESNIIFFCFFYLHLKEIILLKKISFYLFY